jgi:hypothetical protein
MGGSSCRPCRECRSASLRMRYHRPSASNCYLPQSGHEAGDPQISPACQMLLAMRADRVLRRRERGALPALAPFGRDRDESLFPRQYRTARIDP